MSKSIVIPNTTIPIPMDGDPKSQLKKKNVLQHPTFYLEPLKYYILQPFFEANFHNDFST